MRMKMIGWTAAAPNVLVTLMGVMLLGGLVFGPQAASADPDQYAEKEYGPKARQLEFILSGSGANEEEFDRGSFSLAASLGYFLTDGFAAGARHNMTFFDSDELDRVFAATTRVFAEYHLDFDRFQPFLGANIGIRYGNEGIDETGTFAPELGVKFFALENAFILGMAEYQIFFEDADEASDGVDDGQFVYTVGIGFLF